jgi:hypothetical protein
VRSKVEQINWLRRGAKTRSFACIEAHLWAISDRISWNICRGTATSAIWNMT